MRHVGSLTVLLGALGCGSIPLPEAASPTEEVPGGLGCPAVAGRYEVSSLSGCGAPHLGAVEVRQEGCRALFPGWAVEGSVELGAAGGTGTLRVGSHVGACDVRVEGAGLLDLACGSTCFLSLVRPAEVSEPERVTEAVRASHEAELHTLVGQYARGDTPVYRGTFSARDNKSSLGGGYRDGAFSGPVIASLAAGELWTAGGRMDGHALTVISPATRQRVRLSQLEATPSSTEVSLVTDARTSYGVSGACAGCLTRLSARPQQLNVTGIVATGRYGTGQPLHVEAQGSLARVPPERLTFSDVVELNDHYELERLGAREFTARGGDLVRTVTRTLREAAPVPEGEAYEQCERVTDYRVEEFVSAADLTRYGIRALDVTEQKTCCFDGRAMVGCVPGEWVCF